jgi:hypothetical protein
MCDDFCIQNVTEKSEMGSLQSENPEYIREIARGFPICPSLRSVFYGGDMDRNSMCQHFLCVQLFGYSYVGDIDRSVNYDQRCRGSDFKS